VDKVTSEGSDLASEADQDRSERGGKEQDSEIDFESIPAPDGFDNLRFHYELLKTLVGQRWSDFLTRTSALHHLICRDDAWLGSREVDRALYWLDEDERERVIRVLRQGGWLEHRRGRGYRIPDEARWVYESILFLIQRATDDALELSVSSLEHAIDADVPVEVVLPTLRNNLRTTLADIEDARKTHSPVVLQEAMEKLGDVGDLSDRVLTVLDEIDPTHPQAREDAHQIHSLLSRLELASSELQDDLAEVQRQFLPLESGVSHEDIVGELMDLPAGEIAKVGEKALQGFIDPPLLVTQSVMAAAAESQMVKGDEEVDMEWSTPSRPEPASAEEQIPPEVEELLQDLQALTADGQSKRLSEIIPGDGKATSFLRADLLPLVEHPVGGDGVTGRFANLDLELAVASELEDVPDGPIKKVSEGRLVPEGGDDE
jgi:hypothetical protein